MFQPADALCKWPIACLIFCTIRNLIPDNAGSVESLLINTDNAVATLLEKCNDTQPAIRATLVFPLCPCLCGNAHIRLHDRPRIVLDGAPAGRLGRINS